MMQDPQVLVIVKKFARQYLNNVEKAVEKAEEEIRDLPNFQDLVDDLVRCEIRGLIYQARGRFNRDIKRQFFAETSQPKVKIGESDAVVKAYLSVFDQCIGGRRLGSLLGKELKPLAGMLKNQGDGCYEQARFLLELEKVTPANKTVENALTAKKAEELQKKAKEVA